MEQRTSLGDVIGSLLQGVLYLYLFAGFMYGNWMLYHWVETGRASWWDVIMMTFITPIYAAVVTWYALLWPYYVFVKGLHPFAS